MKIRFHSIAATWLLVCSSALAQEITLFDGYNKRIENAQSVSALGNDVLGEEVSLYSGSTEFTAIDIDLPGSNSLPVQLRRRFKIQTYPVASNTAPSGGLGFGGIGEWDIDIPHIYGVFSQMYGWQVNGNQPYSRCSSQDAVKLPFLPGASDEFWRGIHIHIPGQGGRELLRNLLQPMHALVNPGTYPWVAKDFWRIKCKPSTSNGYPGEGFIAESPDGVRYIFDVGVERPAAEFKHFGNFSMNTKRVQLMASRIEDRFGNWVAYQYSNGRLTGIQASDGRQISFAYSGSNLSSATAGNQTWSYQYRTGVLIRQNAYQTLLGAVVLPDGSRWEFTNQGWLGVHYAGESVAKEEYSMYPLCDLEPELGGAGFSYTIKHPSGVRGEFGLSHERHYRSNVQNQCQVYPAPPYYYEYPFIPHYFDTFTLGSKTLSGPGMPSRTWTYEYQEIDPYDGRYYDQGPCNYCISEKKVIVHEPDGSKRIHRFGIFYDVNEGRELGIEVVDAQGATSRVEEYVYMTDTEAVGQPFPSRYGNSSNDSQVSVLIRPLKQRALIQDGVRFSRESGVFDAFGRPTSVTRSRAPSP